MASYVATFPDEMAVCEFLVDFMDEIVVRLFWCILDVFKYFRNACLAIAAEFNGAGLDVVEGCYGVSQDYECIYAAKFAVVGVDVCWVAWGDIHAGDPGG